MIDFAIATLPRKKAIAGFYSLALAIGLCFFIPQIRQSQIISTIFLAIGRIAGSKY